MADGKSQMANTSSGRRRDPAICHLPSAIFPVSPPFYLCFICVNLWPRKKAKIALFCFPETKFFQHIV
jgi:hypothetical protein